jgi:hypothetical protein
MGGIAGRRRGARCRGSLGKDGRSRGWGTRRIGGWGGYGRPASPLLLLRLLESSLCSKGVNTGRYATKPGKEATKL